MRKRLIAIILTTLTAIGSLGLTGCSSGGSSDSNTKKADTTVQQTSSNSTSSAAIPAKINGKKLKLFVVSKIGGDDHTAQFLAGAKQEGEAVGATVDTFSANGDSAKFHDAINQALQKDYDGFVISHGDDAATVEDVKKIVAKGKSVVSFDSNTDVAKVEGVTLTAQDDESLALLSFKKLIQDHNGKANIIYLWVDGFPPMVNRNRIYSALLQKYPGIKEVERFGVATADTSVQTQNAVAAMLAKHPKGEIDAIYASWDAFAIGATRAVKEAGRSEIKIYGIDSSNADLQAIQEKNSPWVETSAVDPKLIGSTDIKLLLKKIAGETTPTYYDLEANIINGDALRTAGKPVNMQNLSEIIPGWGKSNAFEEPWIKALKEKNGKK
jgi:ABC-type sugar transport system, periplasmic component